MVYWGKYTSIEILGPLVFLSVLYTDDIMVHVYGKFYLQHIDYNFEGFTVCCNQEVYLTESKLAQ